MLVFAFFFHRVIVTVEDGDNVFLALKVFRVNADRRRFVKISVAQFLQIALIGGRAGRTKRSEELFHIILSHIHPEGTCKGIGVNLHGIAHRILQRITDLRHGALHLGLNCRGHLRHHLFHRGSDLCLQNRGDRSGVASHNACHVVCERRRNLGLQSVEIDDFCDTAVQPLLAVRRVQIGDKVLAHLRRIRQAVLLHVSEITVGKLRRKRSELVGCNFDIAVVLHHLGNPVVDDLNSFFGLQILRKISIKLFRIGVAHLDQVCLIPFEDPLNEFLDLFLCNGNTAACNDGLDVAPQDFLCFRGIDVGDEILL